MPKLFKYPVKLLFAAHACSLFLFSFLYWNDISDQTVPTQVVKSKNPFIQIVDALTQAAGKSTGDWMWFVGFTALLYSLFLIGLKLVSGISLKELCMFVLITIPSVLFITEILSFLLSGIIQPFVFPITLILLSFLLLKLSDYWDFLYKKDLSD